MKQSNISAMKSHLYNKYSFSQDIYYKRDINSILSYQRSPAYIRHQEGQDLERNVKTILYSYSRYQALREVEELSDYYRYHFSIPRFFQTDFEDAYFDFYSKKRALVYEKVNKLLKADKAHKMDPQLSNSSADDTRYTPFLPNGINRKDKSSHFDKDSKYDTLNSLLSGIGSCSQTATQLTL